MIPGRVYLNDNPRIRHTAKVCDAGLMNIKPDNTALRTAIVSHYEATTLADLLKAKSTLPKTSRTPAHACTGQAIDGKMKKGNAQR